ncbi:MAG: tetratricopeptide repeat protein [Aureispira sp.]
MIFSFYSYKGGVGRSQLCANVAAYLCHKRNKKVLLLDWDFEAPGLHYFFDEEYHDIGVKGSLELLEEYMAMMLTQEQVTEADYRIFDRDSVINIANAQGWKEAALGCIDLIPAGCYNENYTAKINNFNWFQFYNRLDGKVYIEWLKKELKTLDYDYILIDSRTGINDYSGICNLHLPDANIVVMAANSQNMKGCKNLIEQIINHPYTQHQDKYRTKYILPVLSRINVNNPNFDHWADQFVANFQPLMEYWETELPTAFRSDIFRDFYLEKTLLEDMPQYSAGENVLFSDRKQRIHRSSFAAKFANLAQYLEDLKEKGTIQLEEQIDRDAWEYYAQEAEFRLEVGEITRRDVAYAYEQAGDGANAERFGGTVELYLEEYKEYFTKEQYDKAKEVLLKAKDIDSENLELYIGLSRVYQRLKEGQNAENILLKAIEMDSKNASIRIELGKVYQQKKEWSSAKDILLTAIAIDPNSSYALVQLGKTYQHLKEWDKAEEKLLQALQIDPEDSYAFVQLSKVYLKKEQWNKAEQALLEVLRLRPQSGVNRIRLLTLYQQIQTQPQKVQQLLQELIELEPNYTKWHLQLARSHQQQKEWDLAKNTLAKALDTNEEEVLAILQESIQKNPKNPAAYIELGRAYQQLQRWGKALSNYEKVLELAPRNTTASTLIGNVYFSKGSIHIAIEYYQKSLSIDNSNGYVYYRLGRANHEIGNYTAAIENYKQCLALQPTNKKARSNLGVVYYKNEQIQLAIEIYLQSLTMDEDHEVYNNNIGYLYLMTGDPEQSLPYLKRSLALGLMDFASRNLGHYYLVQHEQEQALKHYQQSWEAFEEKGEFWSGMEQDFQYLKQYGLTLEEYERIKKALLGWIDDKTRD